jgi:hypothetical protein
MDEGGGIVGGPVIEETHEIASHSEMEVGRWLSIMSILGMMGSWLVGLGEVVGVPKGLGSPNVARMKSSTIRAASGSRWLKGVERESMSQLRSREERMSALLVLVEPALLLVVVVLKAATLLGLVGMVAVLKGVAVFFGAGVLTAVLEFFLLATGLVGVLKLIGFS